jgi:hypothetical protein
MRPTDGRSEGILDVFGGILTMDTGEPTNGQPANRRPDGARMIDGTFAKGNRIGRGNPVNRRMAELRRALVDATDPARVKAVGAKLAELAEAGDVAAARTWLDYVIGRPIQALELSGPDGEPLGGDLDTLRTVIMSALDRHPAAKVEVAAALMRLRIADGPDTVTGQRD